MGGRAWRGGGGGGGGRGDQLSVSGLRKRERREDLSGSK
jgi:hypothetical protein